MPARGLGSSRTKVAGCAIAAVVAFLAAMIQSPRMADAASSTGPGLFVAPGCAVGAEGDQIRLVILGLDWPEGDVALSVIRGDVTTRLVTVPPRPSPVSQRPGTFTVAAAVTAPAGGIEVTAVEGDITRRAVVGVDNSCGAQISVKPPCLGAPGRVQVTGTGFNPGGAVTLDIDPLGNAEAKGPATKADRAGSFTATVSLRVPEGPLAIIANFETDRAIAFVDPCPPPPTSPPTRPPSVPPPTPRTTPPRSPPATPPANVPPTVPPVTVPTPGASARVSISPQTVRPGRCAVLVFSGAPAATPLTARFADGPAVNAQIGPDGRAVVSVCVPHDAGNVLGPVAVLVSIGPFGPSPLFRVLRVPDRPQPPMLQTGADTRRS